MVLLPRLVCEWFNFFVLMLYYDVVLLTLLLITTRKNLLFCNRESVLCGSYLFNLQSGIADGFSLL